MMLFTWGNGMIKQSLAFCFGSPGVVGRCERRGLVWIRPLSCAWVQAKALGNRRSVTLGLPIVGRPYQCPWCLGPGLHGYSRQAERRVWMDLISLSLWGCCLVQPCSTHEYVAPAPQDPLVMHPRFLSLLSQKEPRWILGSSNSLNPYVTSSY